MTRLSLSGQRWRDRRDSFRPPDDERFNPSYHEVRFVGRDRDVAQFVSCHHYSGSCPNSGRFRFQLIDTRRPSWASNGEGLVGCAVFGSPSGPAVLKSAFPFLGDSDRSQVSCELSRLVLLDEVLRNGESWFVRQCLNHLKREENQEAVVSFSDPVPRWDGEGKLVLPGHVGIVYQALSATYTGRSKSRWSWVRRDGVQINERDLTKVRAACPCCGTGNSASGGRGAVERFVSWGCRAPAQGECWRAWLVSVLPQIAARRRHGGNHRYLWGLNKAADRGLLQIHGSRRVENYPKQIDRVERRAP